MLSCMLVNSLRWLEPDGAVMQTRQVVQAVVSRAR